MMATTICGLGSEVEVAEAFDNLIVDMNRYARCFRSYSEVWGDYLFKRPEQHDQRARIDRILTPQRDLVEAGWQGIIGVELKGSDTKMGKPVVQSLDYLQAVFTLPNCGFRVMIDMLFVFPCEPCRGDLASVMTQNRIGVARPGHLGGVWFGTDNGRLIEWGPDGLFAKQPPQGRKRGNRG